MNNFSFQIKFLIILALILLISSCVVTKHFTTDEAEKIQTIHDYEKLQNQLLNSFLTSSIPGLTQFLNKEYIEGALYIASITGAFTTSLFLDEQYWKETAAEIGIVIWVWNYTDGIGSTWRRLLEAELLVNPDFVTQYKKSLAEQIAAQEKERRAKTIPLHPDTRNLRIGMTKQETLESIGKPNRISKIVGIYRVTELWSYYGTESLGDEIYLYFTDGELTSWRETRYFE